MSKFTRRQFLRSAGGTALYLPILTSLLPKAAARAACGAPKRKLVLISLPNSVPDAAWFPKQFFDEDPKTNDNHATPTIRALSECSNASIPKVFANCYRALQGDMILPAGMGSYAFAEGHNPLNFVFGGQVPSVSSWANMDGNGTTIFDHPSYRYKRFPTIDVFLEQTGRYNADGEAVPVLRLNPWHGDKSFSHAASANTPDDNYPHVHSLTQMYSMLFGSVNPAEMAFHRFNFVDSAREDYRRLKNSPKIGAADKLKIDEWVEHVRQVERSLSAVIQICGSCSIPPSPTTPAPFLPSGQPIDGPTLRTPGKEIAEPENPSTYLENADARITAYFRAMVDLAAAALLCDRTNIVTFSMTAPMHLYSAYNHFDSHGGLRIRQIAYAQWIIDNCFRLMVDRLATATATDGKRVLDHALVTATMEHLGDGNFHRQHPFNPEDMGTYTVMAGKAGGFIADSAVGKYMNHMRYGRPIYGSPSRTRVWLPLNCYWNTLLQSMGSTPAEYEAIGGKPGWGNYDPLSNYCGIYQADLQAELMGPSIAQVGNVIPRIRG